MAERSKGEQAKSKELWASVALVAAIGALALGVEAL